MRIQAFILSIWLIALMVSCAELESDLVATELRCEYLLNPSAVDEAHPRLSWIVEGDGRGRMQTAYRILVSSSKQAIDNNHGDLWDSGKINSDQCLQVPYRGHELTSRQACFWKVMIWDERGKQTNWSDVGSWRMGLLNPMEWKADWIGFDSLPRIAKPLGNQSKSTFTYTPAPSPYLRKSFTLDQIPASAQLYATALGLYEVYINGVRVGRDHFTPGWSDYRKRIYYQCYDVSSLLQEGENVVGVVLADGWYAGTIANRGMYHYGEKIRFKAQLFTGEVGEEDLSLVTDSSWKASDGPVREADLIHGETYDSRLAQDGWNEPGFDDVYWKPVHCSDTNTAPLEGYPSEKVQVMEQLKPASVSRIDSNTFIVDFEQNFAGWVRMRMQGEVGDSVVIRYGEVLNADGTLHTRNLRTARSMDTYVVNGKENGTMWEPRFTYHGFRYAEISGYVGDLSTDDLVGVVVHSNLRRTGSFNCSNDKINQLYDNILWSQRSNFFEIPTDNPQRDERQGWGGDAHVFMSTACYNMDVAAFYSKWLVALTDGQLDDGRIPSTGPMIYQRIAAGWGDAAVICPWKLYQWYGDTVTMQALYPDMEEWMTYLEGRSEGVLSTMGTYGDWQNSEDETPTMVVANAFFKHSSDLMCTMAEQLGYKDRQDHYAQLSESIKQAFQDQFINDSGQVEGHTQTGYLLALAYDLVAEDQRDIVKQHLIDRIREEEYHLATGVLGTHLMLPTLTAEGELELAYRLLLQESFPSWLYPINNGATTIWERWDSYSIDEGIHRDSTNSLNQYAFGAVGEWLYGTIAGIQPIDPGYKTFRIAPRPGGDLTHAKASFHSSYGLIESGWSISNGKMVLEVRVPPNTTAEIVVPCSGEILENGLELSDVNGIQKVERAADSTLVGVGSGIYRFEVECP